MEEIEIITCQYENKERLKQYQKTIAKLKN